MCKMSVEKEMFGYRWRYEADKLYKLSKKPKQWRCCNELKPHPTGYIHLWVNGKRMLLHRLVYLFHNPEWDIADTSCDNSIDHVNGVKNDNRIENLRVVNASQNGQNRTHMNGRVIKGVSYYKRVKRWQAYWRQDGKLRSKYFKTEADALAHRAEMVRLHYTHAPTGTRE
jgi:hypothetical protein